MDYYIRYFYDYIHEHGPDADRVTDYVFDYLEKRQEINREISAREIHKHCENCLGIAIPYKAFLGALIYNRYRLCDGRQDVYLGLSTRAPILRIRRGEPLKRRDIKISTILSYYGERGLDPKLFDEQPDAEDAQKDTQ